MRRHVGNSLREVVDVVDPAPTAKSVSLRSKMVGDGPSDITSAEEPLSAKLLGQMQRMSMRCNTTSGAQWRTLGLEVHDAVARHAATETFPA